VSSPVKKNGLKFRWWQALESKPPTDPVWIGSRGSMCAVAMVLSAYANPDGSGIFPSASTVAGIAGLNRGTVEKHRKRLVEMGLIEQVMRSTRKGAASRFRLCEPLEWRATWEDAFGRELMA
jgi:pyocin large subunit-like protein